MHHEATPEMRRVCTPYAIASRSVPVERWSYVLTADVDRGCRRLLFGRLGVSLAVIAAVLAGTAAFPILLPWLPTHDFSTKGFVLGVLVALPFVLLSLQGSTDAAWWYSPAEPSPRC